jgi:hypothetical protein
VCGVLRVLLYREGMNRIENMCSPRPSLALSFNPFDMLECLTRTLA